MKVTVIHMPHPSAPVDEDAVRVAEVSIPAEIKSDTEACEYAYHRTQNIFGSWSIKDGNADNCDSVKRMCPLHEGGMGLRSSMMGDHFIVHGDNAWSHNEQGEVYECAMLGFEHKNSMILVDFLSEQQEKKIAYGVERVELV